MSAVSISRRLFLLAAIFAYLQIALGGIVRVSGSGLGCPDWPLCHGRPYPPANLSSIIEYSHRTVGAITGVLIIAAVVAAWVVFRNRRPIVAWMATASLAAVAVEGGLGSLIATAVLAMPDSAGNNSGSFKRLASAAVVATYVLLLTGSSVVATNAD